MATTRRDAADLAAGVARWAHEHGPARPDLTVDDVARPSSGWSNETLVVTWSWPDDRGDDDRRRRERVVVRLPTLVPSFPEYDLAAQARVLDALGAAGVPSARPIAVEPDPSWLGAPFLIMSFVAGRPGPEAPGIDPWLADAPAAVQRAVHERFLTTLAAVHRVDWDRHGLGAVLRGAHAPLRDEVRWWRDYIDWAADGDAASILVDAARWCEQHAPTRNPPASLCWGDARIGNVMFDDEREIVAALDWELATIGPAELDLAWYLALDELTAKFTKPVPGFLPRDEAIPFYEARLGRAVADLAWHEVFALVRSTAINDRQARTAAAAGMDYPGVAGNKNPVLRYVTRRIERYEGAS
jgi:aminoglycoside phosphotransferase (APT) family kinase protein